MRKIIRNIMLVLVALFVCSSCEQEVGFKDYVNYLNDSMKSVNTIESNIKAYDTTILVYEYNNFTVFLDAGNAEITKTITSLNNSFELETKTEKNTVESINRDNLLNINLEESLLNNLKIDEGKLTFSVTSSNINKVLNYKDLVISGDAEFELSFTNKKISNIKIMLVTASNKNVEVNISYLY